MIEPDTIDPASRGTGLARNQKGADQAPFFDTRSSVLKKLPKGIKIRSWARSDIRIKASCFCRTES